MTTEHWYWIIAGTAAFLVFFVFLPAVSELSRIAKALEQIAKGVDARSDLNDTLAEIAKAMTKPCADCGEHGSAYRAELNDYYCDSCLRNKPF